MNNIKIGDRVVFRGAAFSSGAFSGHDQEGRVIGISGDECAIEQVFTVGKTKILRKPIKSRHVVIARIADVIKDQSEEAE